ncbi:MAG: SDR family oxidoreductase [Pseudomonadota bacterium]
MADLKNKTAFITGAGGGIGRAITTALHDAGAVVAGADISAPRFEENDPAKPDFWAQLDITSEGHVERAFQDALKALGRIDVLVNNAGLVKIAAIEDMTVEEWDETMNVNLKGAFFCCREAVRHMKSRGGGGAIINISSTAGRIGVKNHVHYCASKAGLLGLTKGLALDMAPHGVTVNAICPGPTDTGMLDEVFREQSDLQQVDKDAYERQVVASIPVGRKIPPQHVADAVVFLASPGGASVTGQTLSVDGGIVRL